MIDKICLFLTNKIRQEVSDIDDERAEVINYGLQILVGEIPKTFVMLAVAYLLGVFKLSLIAFAVLIPYRGASGGFHLHTHIGCIVTTCIMYSGVALLSKYIVLTEITKYLLIASTWIFGIIMIKLYAPADTEAVPILRKKERKIKKYLSYLFITLNLVLATLIKNNVYSNLLIFGSLIQTITITRFIYKLTNNKYGYEEYMKNNEYNTAS